MSKSHYVYLEEWVKTSMLSEKFNVTGLCEICGHLSAGAVWHSIKTHKTRCLKCLDPVAEYPNG